MGGAKGIILKIIPSKMANDFIKKNHYSGKVVNSSKVHFGAFHNNQLHGVLSYGNPLDKRKVLPLVQPSKWNEMLELNRMAFDSTLPKNSESRCIAISIQLIKKNAPHIKWLLSFADATQCGDGTIYRAAGFILTSIKVNKQILRMPNGKLIARKTLDNPNHMGVDGRYGSAHAREQGAIPIPGFQLRYIYLIDKSCKITVPILPFSKIKEMGAEMYRGQKIKRDGGLNKSRMASSYEMAVAPTPSLNKAPTSNAGQETGKPSSNGEGVKTAIKEAEIGV